MNSIQMGKFISEQRKSMQMTQKELADKLHITDKAVSKWERGLSCPDITLLSELADILNVTLHELLNAEKVKSAIIEDASIENALQYADITTKHRVKSFRKIAFIMFSSLLIIAGIVCLICDVAMTRTLTWSKIPIVSMILAWLILTPLMKLETKQIRGSLLSLSVCILPYFYILSELLPAYPLLFPIAWRCAITALVYLWTVFFLFQKYHAKKYYTSAISILLVIPVDLGIKFICADLVRDSALIDVWDLLGIVMILIIAAVLFFFQVRNKNNRTA